MNARPAPGVTLVSQKMGIHEWSYDNAVSPEERYKVPWQDKKITLRDIKVEVELGFDAKTGYAEAQRCLNCDIQTVFTPRLCIECDACVDICPTDCITFTANGEEADLRQRLTAPSLHTDQSLYVSENLKTGRIMSAINASRGAPRMPLPTRSRKRAVKTHPTLVASANSGLERAPRP